MLPKSALFSPRRDFRGSSDKYQRQRGPIVVTPEVNLSNAIAGLSPIDPSGVYIGDNERENIATRLIGYRTSQRYYDGHHWSSELTDELEQKSVFNFCRVVVDKAVDWFVAKGWKVASTEGNEQVAELLNMVWDQNNRTLITQKGAQAGATKGDHYIYVTVRTSDQYGKRLPKKEWTIRLQVLPPEYVFPVWSGNEEREMVACLIQYPIADPEEYTQTKLFSVWITPDEIITYMDTTEESRIPNPIGEVNVVHFPNFPLHDSMYGASDIEDIIPINVDYNTVAYAVRRVIRYHAEPTTVIFGCRASTLEKGANSVWSGLPTDARVENLILQSNLEANFKYMDLLKTEICELSCTPKIAFDSFDVRIASSSAAALELMFQPLIEKTRRRQVSHTYSVKKVNRLVMLTFERVLGLPLEELADDPERIEETQCDYTTPLPRDEGVELDLAIKRFNAGIWSQAEMIRRVSHVNNHERLIVELLADKRAALAEVYEKQRALQGERPNSAMAFLGSMCLSEEMETLQKEVVALEQLEGKRIEIPKDKTPVGPAAPKRPVKR